MINNDFENSDSNGSTDYTNNGISINHNNKNIYNDDNDIPIKVNVIRYHIMCLLCLACKNARTHNL